MRWWQYLHHESQPVPPPIPPHHAERGVGIVGSVEELLRREVRRGPVARGEALRFPETLAAARVPTAARTPISTFVAAFPEDVVEVEDVADRDAQARADLAVVIPQTEADLQDPRGLQQLGDAAPALRPMKLKDEGAIPQGKLDARGPPLSPTRKVGFDSGSNPAMPDATISRPACSIAVEPFWERECNPSQPLERLEQSGFRFRGSDKSHLWLCTGASSGLNGETSTSCPLAVSSRRRGIAQRFQIRNTGCPPAR